MDNIALVHFRAGNIITDAFAGDRKNSRSSFVGHERPQAAGIKEILHQKFTRTAAHWREPGISHEISSKRLMSSLSPARRAIATTWIMAFVDPPIAMCTRIALSKAAGVRIFLWRHIIPDQVHNAAAGGRAHPLVTGIGSRDRCSSAWQRHPERLGDCHHRRRRATNHAGTIAARDTALEFGPVGIADAAARFFIPIFPCVGTRTDFDRASFRAVAAPLAHRSQAHPC